VGVVATVTLDDRPTRNSLNRVKLEHLAKRVRALGSDPQVRLVVLNGAAPGFSAGWNLKGDDQSVDQAAGRRSLLDACAAIRACPSPIIAVVEGYAIGAALALLAACDIVVAAENVRFAFPEARFGLVADAAIEVCRSKIREIDASLFLLGGDYFKTVDAIRCGLVSLSVPANEVAAVSKTIEASILGADPGALLATKRVLRAAYGGSACA
jgi:enoyl-CoA hydratase/carnithine racemase